MVPRRNQGPHVAADTWMAAWHALVSRFLVMIHYQITIYVLFSRVPSLVISPDCIVRSMSQTESSGASF
jgi:hypothetical protein